MAGNCRPAHEIKGTSLIRALDVQEVKDLIRSADVGVDLADHENDYEQKMYALGVLALLRWLDGSRPTKRLAQLLNVKDEI